jgi:predicted MFS family arabinose efflux permease
LSSRRVLVSSLAATTTAGYGVLFYAYGVLLLPMEADLGWRRSVLTGAFTAALVVNAVLTIPVGRWLDRHEPRPLLTLGALAGTVLVVLWGLSDRTAMFYAVWIGLGACMAVLFYEPAFTILTKRLAGAERHRAITAVTLLAGLASTIFGPLTALLERSFGWRGAVVTLGVILGAVTIPLFTLSLRGPAAREASVAHPSDTAPRDALRSPRFWGLTAAYVLSSIATFAIAVYLVPYLRGEGWTSASSAVVLGCVGLVQVLGRSIFGRLTLRWSAASLGTWVLGSKAVGIAILTMWPTPFGIAAFLIVYGAANGLQTLTRATVVADLYGAAHYGSISAVISAICSIIGSFAPFAVVGAVELVGSDEPVLWGLAAVALASALANELAVSGRRRSVSRLSEIDAVPDLEA